jgi:hypothetical protein
MLRRDLGLVLAGSLVGCARKPAPSHDDRARALGAPAPGVTTSDDADWKTLEFGASDDHPSGQRALLLAPAAAASWPVCVALHGRGEAGRGLDVGAHGWRDDYRVGSMHARLRSPPLADEDLGGLVTGARLAELNRSLEAARYEGLALVCPYTPVLSDPSPAGAASFARFVVDELVPRAWKTIGRDAGRERTGIDGVSMGGRLALLVGLTNPLRFGSIGALQPAIHVDEADGLASLAKKAFEAAGVTLRLVTSEGDPFREAVEALAQALDAEHVPHRLVVTPGPHDYVWNRGPGSCELLLHHERALRKLAPP